MNIGELKKIAENLIDTFNTAGQESVFLTFFFTVILPVLVLITSRPLSIINFILIFSGRIPF